jgi:hypothetical protein
MDEIKLADWLKGNLDIMIHENNYDQRVRVELLLNHPLEGRVVISEDSFYVGETS